jgi:hypothetical protein
VYYYVCVRGGGLQAKQTQGLNRKELPTKDRKDSQTTDPAPVVKILCVVIYVCVRVRGLQAKQTQGLNRKELPAKDKKDS